MSTWRRLGRGVACGSGRDLRRANRPHSSVARESCSENVRPRKGERRGLETCVSNRPGAPEAGEAPGMVQEPVGRRPSGPTPACLRRPTRPWFPASPRHAGPKTAQRPRLQSEHSPRIRAPIGLYRASKDGYARAVGASNRRPDRQRPSRRPRGRALRILPHLPEPTPRPRISHLREMRPPGSSPAPTGRAGCPRVAPQGAAAAARYRPGGDPPSDPKVFRPDAVSRRRRRLPGRWRSPRGHPFSVGPCGRPPTPSALGGSSDPARLSAGARRSLRASLRGPGASRHRSGEAGPSTGGTLGGSCGVPWERSADRPGTPSPPGTVPCR
jgi:hypothetical protein